MQTLVRHWWPSALLMLAIFLASSRPADQIPDFGVWDRAIKKTGHMVGFGLLALAYQHGIASTRPIRGTELARRTRASGKPRLQSTRTALLAWMLAVAYAVTDELHQSYVPGRAASALDVFLFDSLGAAAALLLTYALRQKRSSRVEDRGVRPD